MNENRDARLEGSWQEMKGRVREAWGVLTDDEVDQAKGNWDRLIGIIRERTGESVDAAEEKLNEMLDRVEQAGEPDTSSSSA